MHDTTPAFDIELLSPPAVERGRAVAALADLFGIERVRAAELLERTPVVVRVGASRVEVERYTRALLALGADARVVGASGAPPSRAGASRDSRREPWGSADEAGSGPGGDATPPRELTGEGAAVLKRRTRETAAVTQVQCRRCGFRQPEAEACQRCGSVFAKPASAAAEAVPGRSRASWRSAYAVSPEEDDGLFLSARATLDPGMILREAAAVTGVTGRLGHAAPAPSGSVDALLRAPTGEAAERWRGSADVGFWDKLGRAGAYGLRGSAWQWLGAMAVLGALSYGVLRLMSAAPVLMVQLLGLFLLILLFSAFLAVQWQFFREAFQTAVADSDADPSPLSGLEDFKSEYVLPGEFLCVAALVLWAPLLYVVLRGVDAGQVPLPQIVVLLALVPLVYWPMGMALVSVSGRLTEIFIVTGVVRAIAIGGLEYAFVAALGVLAFFFMDRLVALSGAVTVYAWALLYALLGYVSAVQGYLIGRLLRRRPHMISGTIVESDE
jgi:hypothetical protein